MLYALVLIVTTYSTVPAPTTSFYSSSYVSRTVSQKVIGYFRSERGCLSASVKRNENWPDFEPGQNVTGLCVQVEIPADYVDTGS